MRVSESEDHRNLAKWQSATSSKAPRAAGAKELRPDQTKRTSHSMMRTMVRSFLAKIFFTASSCSAPATLGALAGAPL